jgi:GntR family transcriptional regulator
MVNANFYLTQSPKTSYLYKQMNNKIPPSRSRLAAFRAVNPADPAPLHAQIERELRRMIALPEFQNGALLPDEQTLANGFGVSRGTVRVALTRLVHDGLLQRKAGVGTRVSQRQAAESGIGSWRSFSREMAEKGIQVENFQHKYELAAADAAAVRTLEIKPGTKIWRLDRVRGWRGRPVLHTRSWFHPRLGLTGREDFSQPLYEVIESETGVVVDNAREEFTAVSAKAAMARLLAVKSGEPLLLRSHTVFDAGNRPVEFAEVHYVSSRFTLTLEIRRDGR